MKSFPWVVSIFSATPVILAFEPPPVECAIVREIVTEVVCKTVYVTTTDTLHDVETLAAESAAPKRPLFIQSSSKTTLTPENTDFDSGYVDQSTASSAIPLIEPNLSTAVTGSSPHTEACYEGFPCIGDITYYDTATIASNPSACNTTNHGLVELVLALPHGIMNQADCGKYVTLTYNNVTETGKVVDKCMGCDNSSVDISRALFKALTGSLDAGRISDVEWFIHST